jgi:hypothetical protein
MKTIQIEFGLSGPPTVTPYTQVCRSEEGIAFVISSKNAMIVAVNLAFADTTADVLYCPSGAPGVRQYHCRVDLEDTKDPSNPKGGILWGAAPEHTTDSPRTLKYTITPFVALKDGSEPTPYGDGELDPFIVITKKP